MTSNIKEMVIQRLKELGRDDGIAEKFIEPNEATKFSPRNLKVITISRSMGSGAKLIAEKLAKDLGWILWDKEILEALAEDNNIQREIIHRLDEKHINMMSSYAYSILGNTDIGSIVYTRHLARTIWAICIRNKAVILGRGANFIIPNALHVRIDASMHKRIENMSIFENMNPMEAKKKLITSDKDRKNFLVKSFGRDNVEHFPFDISMYTDRLSHEDVIELIKVAFAQQEERLKKKYLEF